MGYKTTPPYWAISRQAVIADQLARAQHAARLAQRERKFPLRETLAHQAWPERNRFAPF